MTTYEYAALLARVRLRHVPSTAQLISALESDAPGSEDIRAGLYRAGGRAHVVGVTGPAGSGKSTLVGSLVREFRDRGKTVAIVAIDPSSSLTGGSILGDRIRMEEHTLDPGVFVRSMSTRGRLGGISRATVDAVAVLDAAGWDYVIVETVGVGQAEVEIVQIAHTTAVVSVPGLGDDIQAIKAGLLEIADLYVVNKADRPDSDRVMVDILGMLTLSTASRTSGWAIPVLATVGLDGTGVSELADKLDEHWVWLRESEELGQRERLAAAARIRSIAKDLVAAFTEDPAANAEFENLVTQVASRQTDPHSAAEALITGLRRPNTHLERMA